jgi:glycosyltransferase involved in cell wall biosynthesis
MSRKLLIIADTPGWCFDRRAAALQDYAPAGWEVRIEYNGLREFSEIPLEWADAVFLMDPKKVPGLRTYFTAAGLEMPLVSTHNSGVGRPGYSMAETLQAADYVIVNNYAAWAAGRFGKREYRACNISNGVDLRVFKSLTPWASRPNRALWIGSNTKADDIDDVKGYRTILAPLQRLLPVTSRVEPDFRTAVPGNGSMTADEMVDWFNSGRYVVCTSKSEGTPNIVLEGAACGCAVVSSAVGNVPELVINGRNGVVVNRRDTLGFLDAFEMIPTEKYEAMVAAMYHSIAAWDWSARAEWYFALFGELIRGNVPAPFSYHNTPPAGVGA